MKIEILTGGDLSSLRGLVGSTGSMTAHLRLVTAAAAPAATNANNHGVHRQYQEHYFKYHNVVFIMNSYQLKFSTSTEVTRSFRIEELLNTRPWGFQVTAF